MHSPDWLLAYKHNVKSQFGEDGIVAKIFEVVGEHNRWSVELGALNGYHDSNTWALIKEKGWSGVLIEADQTYFERLVREYAGNKRAVCFNAFVSFEGPQSLDALLAGTPLPVDFDLLSLDVDGNEYHLWDSLQAYRPRVVVIEFNPTIPDEVSFVQPRDMSVMQGASLRAFVELGKRKGYELVAANETNAFFVLQELFPKFDMDNTQLGAVHTDRSYITHFFQLYDGTIKIAGNTQLVWHRLSIDEQKLQVLPARSRKYPAYISANPTVRRLKYAVRKLPVYSALQRLRKALHI